MSSPSKLVRRFTFVAVWIVFYLLFIFVVFSQLFDVYLPYMPVQHYNWPIYPEISNELLLLLPLVGLSTILGLVTEHIWRSHGWNTVESFKIIILVIIVVAVLYSIMNYGWQREQYEAAVMVPRFYKLEIEDVYLQDCLNNCKVIMKLVCGGTEILNVSNITISDMPNYQVSTKSVYAEEMQVNGTSFKPFAIRPEENKTLILTFPNIDFKKIFSSNAEVWITIQTQCENLTTITNIQYKQTEP